MKKTERVSMVTGVLLAAALATATATAGVKQVNEFVGTLTEGHEDGWIPPDQPFVPVLPIFGDGSTVTSNGGGATLHRTGTWIFFGQISAHTGNWFQGDTGGGGYTFNFVQPILNFGGFWGTNCGTPGGKVEVYGPNGLLGGFDMNVPLNTWAWNGWEATGGDFITKVKIIPVQGQFNGFIMNDTLRMNVIPAPGALAAVGLGVLAGRRRR